MFKNSSMLYSSKIEKCEIDSTINRNRYDIIQIVIS
jgi:hypothetical protein